MSEQHPATDNPDFAERRKALGASFWSVAGKGASTCLRLISTVVLTRLLFREAFGLMALVNTILIGLVMFSDLGIGASIVQSSRGTQRRFLNTAWTLQAGRGLFLFCTATLLAIPAAHVYDEPQLLWLIPAAGINALLAGFFSTSLELLQRDLNQRRFQLIDVGVQLASFVVTVSWALVHPTVWALVAGSIGGSVVRLAVGHLLLPGPKNRFEWDPVAAREVIHFGRWVLLSSVMTFLASRLDALILGRMLPIGDLGAYSIASNLARLPLETATAVSWGVMFPVLASCRRRGDNSLAGSLARFRMIILSPAIAGCLLLAFGGDWLVRLIYDARYHDAGNMLRMLAAGQTASLLVLSASPALLAVGDSFGNMCIEAAKAAVLVAAMLLGEHHYGQDGLILGVASAGILSYPATALALRRHNLWQPRFDAAVLAISSTALAALSWPAGR